MGTVLLVSNVGLDEAGGRASDFQTRGDLLGEFGWTLVICRVPRPYVLSFLPSAVRCLWLAYRTDADVINTVSNPFHLHLIGFLASLLTGLPWLAEIRDPMVDNPDREPGSVVWLVAKAVERVVVRWADGVVWGDGIQMSDDYFYDTYPSVDASKFSKLPFKGFKPQVFEGATAAEFDPFTITYAGSFYDGWIEPFAFLDGLEAYVKRYSDRDLQVLFYGDWSAAYQAAAREAGLDDFVVTHDFIPYEELVPVLLGSDILLYIGGDDERNRLSVPSKFWDYIGAGVPILGVVDPTFRAAKLIEEHQFGVVASPADPEQIAYSIHAVRSGDVSIEPAGKTKESFLRQRKIAALADVLDDLGG